MYISMIFAITTQIANSGIVIYNTSQLPCATTTHHCNL